MTLEQHQVATTGRPDSRITAAFVAAVVIGGGNFVAVRFSNRELPPFWGAGLRFMLAALVFVAFALLVRLVWPRGRSLRLIVIYGLLSFAISYAFMYWALLRVSASMAAVVLAAIPLVTALLAAAQKLERLNARTLIGAVVVLAGIVWKATGEVGAVVSVTGVLAMAAASVTIGQSMIISKKVSHHHPAMVNAVGMSSAFPLLLLISLIAGESWVLPQSAEVIWAVAYLVLLGSVGMFVLFLLVIRRWTASATAYAACLFPVVTMLLESWLEGVPLTARGVSGALLVMVGVWFGVFLRPRPAMPSAAA